MLRTKLYLQRLSKYLIFGLSLLYIAYVLHHQWGQNKNLPISDFSWWPFLLSLALLPANLLLENQKWQQLLRAFKPLTLGQSMSHILKGSFYSFFSPNRLGDGLGRVLHLPKETQVKASHAFALGSFFQLMCTLLFGAVGWLLFENKPIDLPAYSALWGTAIALTVLLVFVLLLKQNTLARFLSRIHKKWAGQIFHHYALHELSAVFALSLLRYAVFSSQYVLCLMAFGVDLSLAELYSGISLVYLISTVVPSPLLAELGIRESAALFIFLPFSVPAADILAASLCIWTMNLLVPALIGAALMLPTKKQNTRYA